jgi:hypothetical protein
MSFGANPIDVSVLRTYAEAARWEAEIKPIRGRSPECKPLGDRKKTYATIRKENQDIVVRLYNTDLVRWKPDGTVIVNQGSHESNSTRAYLNAVLPMWFHSYQGMTSVGGRLLDVGYHLLHARKDNIFKHDPNNVSSVPYTFTNPRPCIIHRKNRTGSKVVRAKYAPFFKYMRNIKKLLGEDGRIEREEGMPKYISTEQIITLALSSNKEDHYRAMSYLAWDGRGFWGGPADPIAQFEKAMLRHHRNEMLEEVTMPPGVLAVDKFKGLFYGA